MEYKRICPNCNKELIYKSYRTWINAENANSKCKSCAQKEVTKRSGDLSILLDDNNESYYWIGFLLADGSFYDNRLSLTLSIKDKEHLLKFANYINYSGSLGDNDKSITVSVKDTDIVKEICNKFDIKQNKTYNPPTNFSNFDIDKLYCILAGFIDGDGNISHPKNRKDFFLRIKNHSSWVNILNLFGKIICDKECAKINNQGYAQLYITNSKYLQNLKTKILELNIPIMSRKWDIIDLNFISKYTKAEQTRNSVIEMLKAGIKQCIIAEKCNISPASVTKIKKKYFINYA